MPARILIGAVGWTGHVFPALALARELGERGHEVKVETFERWREAVEGVGAGFAPAPEQLTFPGLADDPAAPSLAQAARDTAQLLDRFRPQAVVSDMFTLVPALAAELTGTPRATLIPHPYPAHQPGLPFYTLGLGPPRTRIGALAWRALWPAVGTRLPNTRLRSVRATIDTARGELGLGPLADYDGQISDRLAIVATFPHLEYERTWPPNAHVTGPLPFELAHPPIELPTEAPLVLMAASTERDPERKLARVTVEALESEPVRVLVALNQRGSTWAGTLPRNARVVDWLSYSQVMPHAAAVICHGGHGTIARALAAGSPLLVSPRAGDQAENGARVAWSGAGLMLPDRLLGPSALRASIRRLLGEPRFARRAAEIARWAAGNDGAGRAAALVERLAEGEL